MTERFQLKGSWVLGLFLASLGLSGCGETAKEAKPPAKTETQAPAKIAADAASKAKGKGKSQDPTADMERDELRAYRKQKAGGG